MQKSGNIRIAFWIGFFILGIALVLGTSITDANWLNPGISTVSASGTQTQDSFISQLVLTEKAAVEQQIGEMQRIDQLLRQSTQGSIAYNAPSTMQLGDTITIELLLNPAATPTQIAGQVTEDGTIVTATIEITPFMKAELITPDKDAFDIQPIHDTPEQLIGEASTTRWAWFVTGKKGGMQKITLILYRLIKYQNKDYWREVETYQANIDVKVTLARRLESLDWKWTAGFILTLVGSVLGILTWRNTRNKEIQKEKKTQKDTPVKKSTKEKK